VRAERHAAVLCYISGAGGDLRIPREVSELIGLPHGGEIVFVRLDSDGVEVMALDTWRDRTWRATRRLTREEGVELLRRAAGACRSPWAAVGAVERRTWDRATARRWFRRARATGKELYREATKLELYGPNPSTTHALRCVARLRHRECEGRFTRRALLCAAAILRAVER
jgi:hypothetical protein